MLGKNQRKILQRLLERQPAIPRRRSAGALLGGGHDSAAREAMKGLEVRGLVVRETPDGRPAPESSRGASFSTWGTPWLLTAAGREAAASC